jgi:hypothetical protein
MCPVPFRVQIGWLHGQSVSYLSRAVEDFQAAIADQTLVVARLAATAFQFDPAIAGRTIRTGHIALLHMKKYATGRRRRQKLNKDTAKIQLRTLGNTDITFQGD